MDEKNQIMDGPVFDRHPQAMGSSTECAEIDFSLPDVGQLPISLSTNRHDAMCVGRNDSLDWFDTCLIHQREL